MKRKTATLLIHYVFGTNERTVFTGVYYRGVRLWYRMENETLNAMLEKAKSWAFSNGFTHVKIKE